MRILLRTLFLVIFTALLFFSAAGVNPPPKIVEAANPIILENQKNGTDDWMPSDFDWEAMRDFDESRLFQTNWTDSRPIKGYANLTSVNRGGSINFHVSTTQPSFDIAVYRIGWYEGAGGRFVTGAKGFTGTNYGVPAADPVTGLIEANWPVAYTLNVGANWVSGVYIAKLIAANKSEGYIIFIVRDDSSTADILFQIPVTTYQAYNNWGGKSLYTSNSNGGLNADKVSFDRPYESWNGTGLFFYGDYHMIRWLEKEGYNVAYATNLDTEVNPNLMANHKVFLSNYHDEYWSWNMRQNLLIYRDAGKDLAFFDSNNIYWQVRFEPSVSSSTPNRVMVCYKDTTDPMTSSATPWLTTVQWRQDPVNMPENEILGAMYQDLLTGPNLPWIVQNANHFIYNGTGLQNGDSILDLVGYEYDKVFNNGKSPANLIVLSNSPMPGSEISNAVIHTVPSGAIVFNASTNHWARKLDKNKYQTETVSPIVQQMTRNILNEMIGSAPVTPPVGDYYIYDDAPTWEWMDNNSQADLANTTISYVGTRSIAFTATPSTNRISLRNDTGINTAPYNTLRIALRATQANQRYTVQFWTVTNTNGTTVSLQNYGGTPAVGSWTVYNIPLADLGMSNANVGWFWLRSIGTQPTVYVDEILLTNTTVNTAPTTTGISNVTVNEDATNTVIPLYPVFNDAQTPDTSLIYAVQSNSNSALFTSVSINAATGELTLDYAPDANGTANLVIRATDTGGLFVEAPFTVTVNPVNDAPSFSHLGNQTLPGGTSTAQSVTGWAHTFVFGPTNENSQAVDDFLVTVAAGSDPIFTTPPDIANNGTLTYTPNGSSGTATIEVQLRDNGGTTNGGVNVSTVQTFTITVEVSTAPEITVLDGATNITDGTSTAVDFGVLLLNTPLTKTFTVNNEGNAALTLTNLTLPGGFSSAGGLPASIPALGSATFDVQCDAGSAGTFSGTLQFETNDSDENLFNFPISCEVVLQYTPVPTREIEVLQGAANILDNTATAVDFGSTSQGTPVTFTFTVNNTGTLNLTLSNPVPPSGFSVVGAFPSTIAGGGNANFQLRCDASNVATPSGTFQFTNDDSDENPFNFPVTCNVTPAPAPEIEVLNGVTNIPDGTATAVNFGSTTQGTPIALTFTVNNTGNAALTLSNPVPPSGFSVVGVFPSSVSANSSTTFQLQCNAASVGTPSGTFQFTTNDSDENPFNFPIGCTVTPAPAPEIEVLDGVTNIPDGTATAVNFGSTVQGTPVSRTFTINNTGTASLTLSNVTPPTGFSVVGAFPSSITGGGSANFTLECSAGSVGTASGTFQFTTNDSDENPFNFPVSCDVTPVPAPEIEVFHGVTAVIDGTGTAVDFGSTTQGTPVSLIFTVNNTGNAALTLSNLSLPGGFIGVGSFPASVPANSSATFEVQCAAGSVNTFSGTLQFETNDSSENPFNFPITCSVTAAPTPDIEVLNGAITVLDGTATPIDFGNTTQGTSVSQTFTIQNLGTATLTVSNLTFPTGFNLVGAFPATIAPSTSANFELSCLATSINTFSGTVQFETNDTDENPFNFPITCAVTAAPAPEIDVVQGATNIPDGTTTAVDFGTLAQGTPASLVFTVHNTGSTTLTLSNPVLPTGFALVGNLPASVAVNGTATFELECTAANPGTFNSTFSFTTNDPDENPFNFPVACTVNAPEIQVFVGATEIINNTATPVNFGTTLIGQQIPVTFTINNTGTAPLTLANLSLPTGFSEVTGLPATIAANSSDTFTLQCDAISEGTYSGSVIFENSDADETPFSFPLTCQVNRPRPEIEVAAGAVAVHDDTVIPFDFGTTTVGNPLTVTFTISNTGLSALDLSNLSLPNGYTNTTPLPASILPNGAADLVVQCDAAAGGTYTGEISFGTNDEYENPFNFAVTCAVSQPEIAVSENGADIADGTSTPFNFGNTPEGTPITRTFKVDNTGTAPLTLSNLNLPNGFALIGNFPSSIPANSNANFVVQCLATTDGNYTGTLTFETNDSNENPFNFPIACQVLDAAQTDIQVQKTVNDDMVEEGQTISFIITVTNLTGVPATGLQLADIFPTGELTYVLPVPAPSTGTYDTNTHVWTIGNLTGSATLTFEATVLAGTAGTNIDNQVQIAALDQQDIDSSNDSATASTHVVAPLVVTKTGYDLNGGKLLPNDTVGWVICVTNPDTVAANNVNITDTIDGTRLTTPTTLQYGVRATCPGQADLPVTLVQQATGSLNVNVTIAAIPSGQVGVLYFETQVKDPGSSQKIPAFALAGLLLLGGVVLRKNRKLALMLLLVGLLLVVPANRLYAQEDGATPEVTSEPPPLPFNEPVIELPFATPTPTHTPTPTETATPVPTETHTPVPTETHTVVPTETATELPTETSTAESATLEPTPGTATESPVPTDSTEATLVPTETVSYEPVWSHYESNDAAVQWVGVWEQQDSENVSGGSYLYALQADSALQFSFDGTALRFDYLRFSNFGIFEVQIDGLTVASLDGYHAESDLETSPIFEVGAGIHQVTLKNTGFANPDSAGIVLAIDVLEIQGSLVLPSAATSTLESPTSTPTETIENVPPTQIPTDTPPVVTPKPLEAGWVRYEMNQVALNGVWDTIESSYVSGGSYAYSLESTAWAELEFEGEAVRFDYLQFWNFGIFEVYMDDVLVMTLDGYHPTSGIGTSTELVLQPGKHRLRIQNTGHANAKSQGIVMALDAIDVKIISQPQPEITETPQPTPESSHAEISGRVFNDNDANRVWSGTAESGIQTAKVYLYLDNGDSIFDTLSDTRVEGLQVKPDGTYQFEQTLAAGVYWVWLDENTLPGSYLDTVATGQHGVQNPQSLVVEAATVQEANFAYTLDTDGDTSPDSLEGSGDQDHDGIPNYVDAFDPNGVIYSIDGTGNGNALSGATIRLVYDNAGVPTLADTVQPNPQTTTADGGYRFDIVVGTTHGLPAGATRVFALEIVDLPDNYSFPSANPLYQPQVDTLDGSPTAGSGQIVEFSTPPNASQSHVFHLRFAIQQGDDPIVNNHIAVDAGTLAPNILNITNTVSVTRDDYSGVMTASADLQLNSALAMELTPNHFTVENPGQSRTYTHTLTNKSDQTDQYVVSFPSGSQTTWTRQLRILRGAAQVAVLNAGSTSAAISVAPGETLTLEHVVAVPLGAANGTVNTSTVTVSSQGAVLAGTGLSRTVTDVTTVQSGCLQGILFHDVNNNGVRDGSEPAFPNVRVIVRSGGVIVTTLTTGANGEYNLNVLPLGTYDVQIDTTSIPSGTPLFLNPVTGQVQLNVAVRGTCVAGNFNLVLVDPALSKAGSASQARPGEVLTFTLTLTNPSTTTITNVSVVDPLNGLYIFNSATSTQGTFTFNAATNEVTFAIGTVAPGATVTMTVTVTVGAGAAPGITINNTGILNFAQGPAVNSRAAAVTIATVTVPSPTPTATTASTSATATSVPTQVAQASSNTTNTQAQSASTSSSSSNGGSTLGGVDTLPATGYRPLPATGYRPLPAAGLRVNHFSALEIAILLAALLGLLASLTWGVVQWLAEYYSQPLAYLLPNRPTPTLIRGVISLGLVSTMILGMVFAANLTRVSAPAKHNSPQPIAEISQAVVSAENESIVPVALPITWEDTTVSSTQNGFNFAPPEIPAERLIIPRLGVDTLLVNAPVVGTTWDVSTLTDEVAHLDGTAYPGTMGNAVLAGHIQHKDGLGPFRNLNQLSTGDLVIAMGKDVEYTYIITDIQEVDPRSVEVTYPSNQPLITLISCAKWDNETWSYQSRLVVRAKFKSWRKTTDTPAPAGTWQRYEIEGQAVQRVGDWQPMDSLYTSDGHYVYATQENAEVRLTFTGEKLRIHYLYFWDFGKFEVFVDDEKVATIDGYNPLSLVGSSDMIFLEPGEHTLRIVNTGRHHPDSQGMTLALDAIDVYTQQP